MSLKLTSWNVNGIRAGIKKGFWEKIDALKTDIACLQETKTDHENMQILAKNEKLIVANAQDNDFFADQESNQWQILWHSCTMKKGYSGVAILWKNPELKLKSYQLGLGDDEFDAEGRIAIAEFGYQNLEFVLINGYYPQGGRGPHRIDYKIRFYQKVNQLVNKLWSEGKSVILCGDLNTTITDIDLARAKENRKTTGCLPEERVALNWLVEAKSFETNQLKIENQDFLEYQNSKIQHLELIDTFRYFYPDLVGKYTYWDQITRARERNVGWRIDYFLLDKKLLPNMKKSEIQETVMGSDHAPITLELELIS
jgi:exodeoxyribonuclease-3